MPYMLPLLTMQASSPPEITVTTTSSNPRQQHQQMMRTVSISILVMSLPVLYVSFLRVPPAALFGDTAFWFLMSNSIIIVIAADSGMLFFRSSSSPVGEVDSDGCGGLPFVDVTGGEPADDVKVDSHDVATDVSVGADEVVVPVEINQVMGLREQEDDAVTMVADESDHAYALVLRDDHQGERMTSQPMPETESRDIMVVTPPSSGLAAEAVSVSNGAGMPCLSLTASSRSLARERRLRRRHSHRQPSRSQALVPVQQDKSVVTAEEQKEKELIEYSRLSDEELNRRVEEFIAKFNMEMRLQLEREQLACLAAA